MQPHCQGGITVEHERISVLGLQIAHEEGAQAANIERALSLIDQNPGHQLYVLPELASSGYGEKTFKGLDLYAEPLDGPSFSAFSRQAKAQRCFIAYSFPRRRSDGKVTICAAVVNPQGELECFYDKWHLSGTGPSSEKAYFSRGQGLPAVFSIGTIKVGLCICYDIRFPEIARILAVVYDIHLLLHPGGWTKDSSFATWHPFVVTRAMENGIYIMSPNRAGSRNGHSIFCSPLTTEEQPPLRLGDGEGTLQGWVDLSAIDRIRKAYPVLKDRCPDRYEQAIKNRE